MNMLSVVSFQVVPFNASYGASKAAQWALTNSLRMELRAQGTLVIGIHAGFMPDSSTPRWQLASRTTRRSRLVTLRCKG
ncbi:short-subunit dehydrogenase [Actinopolymorpha pittospori]|uniref:Short-subunit dehydrogenase n=1 Tax=Actinopolymorpha pittospori TaxID=648752 RepID=A0A927MQP5_9ACTN|nr:short-subunit dehydrogenase [Actinopolymorpha pittospori]